MTTPEIIESLENRNIPHITIITTPDATGLKIPKAVADLFHVEDKQHVSKMLYHHLAQASIHYTATIQEARNYFYQLSYTNG